MNIRDIILDEAHQLMKEIETANSRIPTYPYTQASTGRFIIDVNEPEKNIRTKFDVTFSPEGNEEERAYSIAFKESGGDYNQQTGMGIQFRILATIMKIVKEQVQVHDPNILTFQPVKAPGERGNRRLSLYMQYVKGGAGEDFDAFIIGGDKKVNVEKRNPSFPIENGYQPPEVIQDILTQLSVYGGHYQTDLYPNDPDYEKFEMTNWGAFVVKGSQGRRGTSSARRFVDWMFSVPELSYVQGAHEPDRYDAPIDPETRPTAGVPDAPIQRVSGDAGHTATAMMGTFQHFLQSEVYGNPQLDILEPFFETVKSMGDFSELRSRAEAGLMAARDSSQTQRLNEIIAAIDQMKRMYQEYSQRYGTSGMDENQVLNEIEKNLLDLL